MSPKPKGKTKNLGTPVGDFADFLRARLEKNFRKNSDEAADVVRGRLCTALHRLGVECGVETVRKWEQGAAFPTPTRLGKVAKALGYADWFQMVDAIRVFRGK